MAWYPIRITDHIIYDFLQKVQLLFHVSEVWDLKKGKGEERGKGDYAVGYICFEQVPFKVFFNRFHLTQVQFASQKDKRHLSTFGIQT